MIAKRILAPKGSVGFVGLARYVVNAKSGIDPASWERLGAYITDANHEGEKVAWARVTNCISADPGWAVKEINATQARNTRAGGSKSYHLVVSFPEGERPGREVLEDIEDKLGDAVGFADHQRISAVHHNTDNWHLHIAINTVCPRTFRNIAPFRDHFRLQAACAAMEVKHGLTVEQHTIDPRQEPARKVRGRAADFEALHGLPSFGTWVIERKAPLMAARSWQEMHAAAADLDLLVKPRGAGLVIGHRQDGRLNVKASDVDRSLSLKALEGAFGPYEPPGQEATATPAQDRYTRPGRAGALWNAFQAERDAALTARKAEMAALRDRQAKHAAELDAFYRERKRREGLMPRGPQKRAALATIAEQQRQAKADRQQQEKRDRQELLARIPLPNWQGWLEAEAGRGNEAALKALRSRQQRAARLEAQIIAAENETEARHVVHQQLKPAIRRDGRVVYRLQDGGLVSDEASQVRVATSTTAANVLALTLAADRFGHRPLIVRGTTEFCQQVAQLAGEKKLGVRFADPKLERVRTGLDRGPMFTIVNRRKEQDLER